MKYRLATSMFFLVLISLVSSYVYFYFGQIGIRTYNVNDYNAYNMVLKFHRAESVNKLNETKIIINSGSNSNFGFNSELFENKSGYNVVNLSNHAANRLDYLFYGASKVARSGDIIILPLEFSYYSKVGNYTDYHIKSILRDTDGYFWEMSPLDKVDAIVNTPLSMFTKKKNRGKKTSSEVDVISLESQTTGVWEGYTHRSLNKTFDMDTGEGTSQYVLDKYKDANYRAPSPSKYFLEHANEFVNIMKKRNVAVFFTFPTTIKSSKSLYDSHINLKSTMAQSGFDFVCEPRDFSYGIDMFFDTNYHLNKSGAKQRTIDMVKCLKNEGIL